MTHSFVVLLHTWSGQVIIDTLGGAFAFSATMTLIKHRCGQMHISMVFLCISFALIGIILFLGVTTLLDASVHTQAGLVTTLNSLV